MNYQWHYDRLIETRRNREVQEGAYYERHHVLPRSLGGSDDPENIVTLTAREHFVAHWLLWRIHRNRQMAYAFFAFTHFFQGHNHKNRPNVGSSIGFTEARKAHSEAASIKLTGNSLRSNKVLQFSMQGEFIAEWNSGKEAQQALGVCHVTACCRGERKCAGGFLWKYKEDKPIKSKPYKKRTHTNSKNRKPVLQYSADGIFIRKFSSISEAVSITSVPKSSIQSNIAGSMKLAGNFIWKNKTQA